MRASLAILLSAGSLALGGCAYGMGGYGPYGGYGGYDNYNRSGVSIGVSVGSGYGGYGSYGYGGYGGYSPYGYGGYSPYGGGYGYNPYGYGGYSTPYWGWMGDYYYPGTGYYVYDRYRRPHRWTDRQRSYWSQQRERALSAARTTDGQTTAVRENWSDFDRSATRDNGDQTTNRRRNRVMRTQQN